LFEDSVIISKHDEELAKPKDPCPKSFVDLKNGGHYKGHIR